MPSVVKKMLVNEAKKPLHSAWPQEGEIGEGPESKDDSPGYEFFQSVFFFWLHNTLLCAAITGIPYLETFSPCFKDVRHVPAFMSEEYALLDVIELVRRKLYITVYPIVPGYIQRAHELVDFDTKYGDLPFIVFSRFII
ncbi:hypothetical protein ARMGADRAFT_1036546 [Armillaria gallica]|uniref:Uncharacterized protein n=1 Tax=Armillaria gallica TaxID=47427 RepID=A0A2H3D864_ARMGA|nr:hypothetical protein ARMGADRAFT_1036546 [Armillaria gallica]